MYPPPIPNLSAKIVDLCTQKKLVISTAESCTGGLVAGALTETPGSSACLMGGFVTYSNFMKHRLLGVDENLIAEVGAVSEDVAREMAKGALRSATSDISVAITGIAGPDGGTPEKPVGTVHFATARRGNKGIETHHERHYIKAKGRGAIRLKAVEIALEMLLAQAESF